MKDEPMIEPGLFDDGKTMRYRWKGCPVGVECHIAQIEGGVTVYHHFKWHGNPLAPVVLDKRVAERVDSWSGMSWKWDIVRVDRDYEYGLFDTYARTDVAFGLSAAWWLAWFAFVSRLKKTRIHFYDFMERHGWMDRPLNCYPSLRYLKPVLWLTRKRGLPG